MEQRSTTRHTPDCARLLLCCTAFTLLLACHADAPDAPFATYLGKLGVELVMKPADRQPTGAIPPPQVEALQLGLPDNGLDGLDILTVSGCAVQHNISKRGTSLGRMAKPSQQLMLALEYLQLAPECITRLRGVNSDTLADLLEDAWRTQQTQLPALIFNATLGSDEYRAFWLPAHAPGTYPRTAPDVAKAALDAIDQQVRRWLSADFRAQHRDFELLLSEVAGGDGGALLQTLSRQGDWLQAADQMLAQCTAREPLCSGRGQQTAGAPRSTSAQRYFAHEIQPLIVPSIRRYRELLAPVAALESELAAVLPQPYRHWMVDRNRRFAASAGAPQRHLEQLQRFQRACTAD